ncbi:MAG: BMC domain-containing protein [Archangiaceae bacterium]|nr:BMC domain-containing protein [Archangiaceae bacterium]
MSPAPRPPGKRAAPSPPPSAPPPPLREDALGLLELESIAKGLVVADALIKKAAVKLYVSEPMTPGKYVVLFKGPVAEAQESFEEALRVGAALVIDKLLLTGVHSRVVAALDGAFEALGAHDALGIVETHTLAATLLAADTALKAAQVNLTFLQLAKGIGGKGWFTLAGAQADVEAALEAAAAAVEPRLLVATELISRPHRDLKGPGL